VLLGSQAGGSSPGGYPNGTALNLIDSFIDARRGQRGGQTGRRRAHQETPARETQSISLRNLGKALRAP
jgi:hypothetical protein